MTNSAKRALRVSAWRAMLAAPDAAERLGLPAVYGPDAALCEERRARIAGVLTHYQAVYGDDPVRLFRAPGRINLRGMHVDTHGGWLNLMTHQREVIVVSGQSPDADTHVANTDPAFAPMTLRAAELPVCNGRSWPAIITSPEVQSRIAAAPGHWRNYLEGAWRRARHAAPARDIGGLRLVVDSNLPQGAALSSSAALCIALLHAWLGWAGVTLDDEGLILAAQDAEWYTGSRCGTCDQTAIMLGRPDAVIHVALDPRAFTTKGARAISMPADLRVLVINSFTTRSISGAEKIAYTLNRFAYSMAMAIFQHALREAGYGETVIATCRRLSSINAETLGGNAALAGVLQQVPEALTLDALRDRYDFPDIEGEYARYFGDLPVARQPRAIGLRGPLLFGIAESERARLFVRALESGDFTRAGALMSAGHDGDRRIQRDGSPYVQRSDDDVLAELAVDGAQIADFPGAYGASSPALDFLVDAAMAHGALGASLTGAGIAGTVLALCRADDAGCIADGVRAAMADESYCRIAGLGAPLSPLQLAEAVVVNQACRGAGEICGN